MWREPEETWTLNAIFSSSSSYSIPVCSLTNTGRGISARPLTRDTQPTQTWGQTGAVCAFACMCVNRSTLCSLYVEVCMMPEDRQGVYVCFCAHHTSLKTNREWKDGIVHQVQQTYNLQSPAKANELASQAFNAASSSLLSPWLELFEGK